MKHTLAAIVTMLMADVSIAQSEELKKMTATLINARGHLCAEIVRMTPLKTKGWYEVECIAYRGGQSRVSYAIEAETGKVSRM